MDTTTEITNFLLANANHSTTTSIGDPSIISTANLANLSSSPAAWNWFSILQAIIITIIGSGTIIGNGLVLLVMGLNGSKNSSFRSSTNLFIGNLALADFLIGISCLPFKAILTISGVWYFGPTYCTIWSYLHLWLCSASILSVCAICVDRYIGVGFPLKHYQLMSKKNVIWVSVGIWCLAFCLSALPLLAWPVSPDPNPYKCKPNTRLGHVLIASIGILYIPTIIMLALYWRIWLITKEHFRKLREGFRANVVKNNENYQISIRLDGSVEESSTAANMRTSICNYSEIGSVIEEEEDEEPKKAWTKKSMAHGQQQQQQNQKQVLEKETNFGPSAANSNRQSTFQSYICTNVSPEQDRLEFNRIRQVRVAKRLALVVAIFLASYLPYFTVFLIRGLNPHSSLSLELYTTLSWIRYFNSFLNPFLYAAMIPAFTKSFKELFYCKK